MRAERIATDLDYDGTQLRSHFARRTCGIAGDSIVAFEGACHVETEALVDLEDRLAGTFIRARRMLHFIVEHFEEDLERAVLRQRMLVVLAAETLAVLSGRSCERRGDDLFVDGGKLSVSIATRSPVSTLIHLGLNIDAEGAPVETADLGALGVAPASVADELLRRYVEEMSGIAAARCKVLGVPG